METVFHLKYCTLTLPTGLGGQHNTSTKAFFIYGFSFLERTMGLKFWIKTSTCPVGLMPDPSMHLQYRCHTDPGSARETSSLLLDYMSFPAHTGSITVATLLILSLCLLLKYYIPHNSVLPWQKAQYQGLCPERLEQTWRLVLLFLLSFSLPPKKARKLCLSPEVYILQK